MPDSRPLHSLRLGGFDQPPARTGSSPASTFPDQAHRNMPHSAADGGHSAPPMPSAGARRRVYVAPSTRRRRRSEDGALSDPSTNVASQSIDNEAGSRRPKRRRLDEPSPSLTSSRPAIRYGRYGQVEPGRLSMELISCDGGEHRDPRCPDTSLGPENLLKHDKSVYCSERPSANIILRHADDRPFCLEKLHIVGPDDGFTAPVQQGLVYVAMTIKELEKYMDPPMHARRALRERSVPASPTLLSFTEALRDPEVHAASDGRLRQYNSSVPDGPASENTAGTSSGEHHCDIVTSSDPVDPILDSDFENVNAPHRPVTLLSDEDVGPEDNSSQEVLDFRLQRRRLAHRRYEIDRFDTDDRWAGLNRVPPTPEQALQRDREAGGSTWGRLNALMARSRVHDSSSPELDAAPLHQRVRYSDGDPNVASTAFTIRRDKRNMTIKLDPPVSGRFVLLKLWANKSNVDVQSVVLKGYGGNRFFPAISLR